MNVRFSVPQGSILGPMFFNLYVSDLQDHLPSSIGSFQYDDDTTIYSSCPAPELQGCAQELNSTLNTVSSWSNYSHLALNSKKTKTMLLSTSQMSHVHSLDKNLFFFIMYYYFFNLLFELNLHHTKRIHITTWRNKHKNSWGYIDSLDKNLPAITISDSTLQYVNVSKLPGVHFHQHLN